MMKSNGSPSLFNLTGRTALITGSTRGIGFALAQGLAEAGAAVILNSRQQDAVSQAVAKLQALGLNARGAVFDVADPAGVDAAFEGFDREGLAIDILINNAGGHFDEGTKPSQITDDELAEIERLVDATVAAGATCTLGGQRHALGGNFYAPTILTNVSADMPIAVEESFGPVAPLIRFDSDDDAVCIANAVPAGLAAYLYGNDLQRVWSIAERLEYGMVGINEGIISNEVAPFGGVKASGLGREGGPEGIHEYLETKYVMTPDPLG